GAVDVERSATASGGEADPHDIAVAFAPVVAKRIVPDQAVRQMQLDMRARRERRQRGAAGIAKLHRQRILCFGNDVGHAKRKATIGQGGLSQMYAKRQAGAGSARLLAVLVRPPEASVRRRSSPRRDA